MMNYNLLTAGLLSLSAISSSAATISLIDSASTWGSGSASSTLSDFNLGAGNTLAVVVLTGDNEAGPHSVTFGGQAVTNSVTIQLGSPSQRASIFYWINASTTSGDIVANFPATNFVTPNIYGVTALSLSNVASLGDSGTLTWANNTNQTINYSGTVGGFVLAGLVDNEWKGDTLAITGGNISNYLQQINGEDATSAGLAVAYGSIAADGSYTTTFGVGNDSNRNAAALVAFTAIPEPSSFALFAIALSAGVFFSRRRS